MAFRYPSALARKKYRLEVRIRFIAVIAFQMFILGFVSAQDKNEFVGPFKSWANVKSLYGAAGDGKTDDTDKLQSALDNLSNPATSFNTGSKGYMTLYLPAGIYKISKTLVLKGKIGVTIVGEDPAKTIIQWTGKENDTMFWANGSAYFKITRLTWNANNVKGMKAIGIHWKNRWDDGKSRSFASLNIEISDSRFLGGFAVGIGGGTFYGPPNGTGSNDSEITIRRCTFIRCTDAGIKITGFNALDYWIWDCRFENCRYGISCYNGNYHAYRSYFKSSTQSDMYNNGGYYISARECYSTGSHAFSKDDGSSCNPFKRIFQNNTVMNSVKPPVEYYHLGNVSLMENTFTQAKKRAQPIEVALGSWCPGNYSVLSINNKYSIKEPIYLDMPSKKIIRSKDQVLSKPSVTTSTPLTHSVLAAAPVRPLRKFFDVPVNANSEIIQRIINQAAKFQGNKPVVHFPFGKYQIDKPLEIPAGSDMQLVGDGALFASVLLPTKSLGNQFILVVNGPTFITIKDLQIGPNDKTDNQFKGIWFKNVDQKGATAEFDQIFSSAQISLYCDGMNYIQVEKNNSFFSDGNHLVGGKIQEAGKGSFRVNAFGGQFARLSVSNNAEFVAKDCWWEGADRLPIKLSGEGRITIDGALVSPAGADSTPSISIGKFSGRISLMNMYVIGGLVLESDNKSLDLLLWNVHFYHKMDPLSALRSNGKYRAMFMGLSSQCFNAKNPVCAQMLTHKQSQINIGDSDSFLQEMTLQTRKSLPMQKKPYKGNTSNIYVSRVAIGYIHTGIYFSNS